MKAMTEKNLKDAFAGESQAHMKYLAFAAAAEAEGMPNIARLFRAISFAEQAHATGHLRVLGGLKKTSQNLQEAIGGENFEVDAMYPAYLAVAELEGETSAKRSADWALKAERIHASMYGKAKQAADAGKDAELKELWVCETCGHTVEGPNAPERCPVCGAIHSKFRKF